VPMSNAERQALWRKRRKAELDRLRETAPPIYGGGQPEPLRDAEREVAPEIQATLDDVKSEFADLVQEVGECLDELVVGCRNLEGECERLLSDRLQTLRNTDPDYDPDIDEDDAEHLAIRRLHEKVKQLGFALEEVLDESADIIP
jgi:hypothetical protein